MYISFVPSALMKYTFFHFTRWNKSHIHSKHLNILYILKGKRNAGWSFFLLILIIFYGVYYSHTLLQIVLWMWTAGIRVFGRCAIYPVCEIIQPCTTQCIARTIRKAKISCKTCMFKPSAQDFLTPFGALQRYTTLFDSFTDFSFYFYATLNFFSIMVRLTDVQRGRAIALLMQGQRQQQVANHFGVNVSTIERLVRRLRETGHLADRPRSGCPRVTSRRQDRTIRLAHLRNRHLTATETALNTVGTHNWQISPKTVGSDCVRLVFELVVHTLVCLWPRHVGCVVWRGWRRMRPGYFRWGSGDEFFLRTSLDSLSIAQMVDVVCTDVAENALPTPVLSNGIGLGVALLWSGEALLTR